MEQDFNIISNCFKPIFLCFMLSVVYLASLHIWNSPFSRDHPSTIKKRFISVFCMLFISPCFLYLGLAKEIIDKVKFHEILGLKTQGLCQAIFMPLFLTMVLFLGPISMELYSGLYKLYTVKRGGMYWFTNLTDLLIWIRNHIIAPVSEEFTYRSCMLPMLLQCFKPSTAIVISPLFFGVAHFHHIRERIVHLEMDFNTALKISCFQFAYTTLFGMYSAYLFYRTGHLAAICMVHAYCNHMGFPDIVEITTYKRKKKIVILTIFVIGFLTWCMLLKPLTEPKWYYHEPQWYEV